MKQTFSAFIVGAIFGVGLIVSGMTNPEKIIGFLDFTGAWDPSLALVMAGAIATSMGFFIWGQKRHRQGLKSLLGLDYMLPNNKRLSKRLVIGSLAFGAGWGLAGFCPGPALIVGIVFANSSAGIFIVAMLLGMFGFELLEKKLHKKQSGELAASR